MAKTLKFVDAFSMLIALPSRRPTGALKPIWQLYILFILFALAIFSAPAAAQDTTIAGPACGAPNGTTFHGLDFTTITPSGVLQTNYTIPNAAVVNNQAIDMRVTFETAPAPANPAATPSITVEGDFLFNTDFANGSRTATYEFVLAGTNTPVAANYRIRFADIDQGEASQVDLDQFSALLVGSSSNLNITDNGVTATITGAAGNRSTVSEDTAEFVLLNRSSFTATYFPRSPNTGFFFDGNGSLPLNSPQCVNILPISANTETFSTVAGIPGGTTSVSVLDSDTMGVDPVSTGTVTISVISSDAQLTLDTNTGFVTVAAGTLAGAYSVQYQICEIASPTNCDTTTETISVSVPVSSGQICPTGSSNRLVGSDFPDFADWSQSGANAGGLSIVSYTGNPSGQSFTNVVTEDANSTSGTLFQTAPFGISVGGSGQLRLDFGWNNGGSASTYVFSVAGTDVLRIVTTAASNNIDPADFTLINGASATIGNTGFGVNASGKIPVADYNNWDLISIVVNLPTGLPDSGDVAFSYSLGQDDWALDNLLLCGVDSSGLNVDKTSRLITGDDFAIPGNNIVYRIAVSNTGSVEIDGSSLFIVDTLPPEMVFFNGDFNGPNEPGTDTYGYSDTGVDLDFDPTTDAGFSDAATAPTAFVQCNYNPSLGIDENVRHICFRPRGEFIPGSPDPEIVIEFRAQIR